MISKCICPNAGFCSRYGMEMQGMAKAICEAKHAPYGWDDAKRERYLQSLLNSSIHLNSNSSTGLLSCPHHGGTIKDESGRAVQRDCPTCHGLMAKQVVFECTHAARKEQATIKDCQSCIYRPRYIANDAQKLLLWNPLAPGDCLVMTAAIESLHQQFPGKYITDVDTCFPDIYLYNPWITKLDPKEEGVKKIRMEYPAIHKSHLPRHFMEAYCEFLGKTLGINLPLTVNRPYLYFSREEGTHINRVEEVTGRDTAHLVICCGTKPDYTAKGWIRSYWQELVDLITKRFKGEIALVQIGEPFHGHQPLRGVLNQIGKTNTRELIRLCRSSMGGIGPVTFIQHIFAALEKPYVCIAGGREGHFFTDYPMQTTLHTIGMLDCCKTQGCWASRVVKMKDGDEKDNSLCKQTVQIGEETAQKCMTMISPSDVARVVEKYYDESTIHVQ